MDTPFLDQGRRDPLAAVLAPQAAREQLPLMHATRLDVTAAIASLALGGAERIVLDWAAACAVRYRVRLLVLHDLAHEWPVPAGVEVTRLGGTDIAGRLEQAGASIAATGNPVVLCHLLGAAERRALARGGAHPVPVLHNAMAGWREAADTLSDSRFAIAVSRHAAGELHASGWPGDCAVVRHVPRTPVMQPQARTDWRTRWAVPLDATVIGMIGAVKPQKAYTRALRILAASLSIQRRNDTYLVIVGGPIGRDGALAWAAVIAQARRLGVEDRVRMPGFVPRASDCLPAFDLLLNTSRYEGLSIATLEALAAGLPVVASAVGGQGELAAPGLALLPYAAPDAAWTRAIDEALSRRPEPPAWRGAPTCRVWTLFHLLRPFTPGPGVLFVTANLNAGGAQRSLVNLATALKGSLAFEIAVCGSSSSSHFAHALERAGVRASRTADSRDCFDHAEALVHRIVEQGIGTVCFWNVDAKVKLLVVKAFAATSVRLIDVSPGGYSFEELQATRAFQEWIAYSQEAYYERLDRLVLKYRGAVPPEARGKVSVIRNGVPTMGIEARAAAPRIVMSGRIAPSKFLLEAVTAMRVLWRDHPRAELHVLGAAETRHADYALELVAAIGEELGVRVFLHGAAFDAPERVGEFSAALVLGEHQGCPNAVLEALAAGVPVVANDSGGTRELVSDGRTGVLLSSCEPAAIAAGLARVIDDAAFAQRMSKVGRRHVERHFSMRQMAAAYRRLLNGR